MRQRTNMLSPMLYIHQPYMKPPKAKMQNNFKTPTNVEKDPPVPEREIVELQKTEMEERFENENLSVNENDIEELLSSPNGEVKEHNVLEIDLKKRHEQVEQIEEEKEELIINKEEVKEELQEVLKFEKTILKNKTSFRDLDLEGKCNYLKTIPYPVAKIRFIFITTDNKYLGYFISQIEGDLMIFNLRVKQYMRISYDSLIDIKINGL